MPPEAAPPPDLATAAADAVRSARERGRPLLLSWSRRAKARPLGVLAAGDGARLYVGTPGRAEHAGLGAAVVLEASGEGRLADIRRQAVALLGEALLAAEGPRPAEAPGPRFLGGFAFRGDHRAEGGWEDFPAARFTLPALALTAEEGQGWVTVNRLVAGRETPRDLARHVEAQAARAEDDPLPPAARPGVPLPPFGMRRLERADWMARVDRALADIRRRRLEKVVLARRVPVPLTAPLQGPDALARIAPRYASCVLFLAEPRPGRPFLGASPELLARVRGRDVETVALAGSAPRGGTRDEDEAHAGRLLGSPKERAEHGIVARHLRERLAALGGAVEGPSEPGLLALSNVQHLQTPLRARLPSAPHLLEVAAALHPTPAVAGSPVGAALAFLEAREGFPRGWYAGAVGWFDAQGQGDLAVALRCALADRDEAWLFAGAGIVHGAEPALEWDETELKLQPMLEALGCLP